MALTICLPRDSDSIPVSRHVVRDALRQVGVTEECIADVTLAQTEACANVVEHSGSADKYEVTLRLLGDWCVISVTDTGRGFDSSGKVVSARELGERGRGIALMQALVDNMQFVSRPGEGTTVYLKKSLEFREGSLGERYAVGR
jgi:serine/threonine-protein kinase RsbW